MSHLEDAAKIHHDAKKLKHARCLHDRRNKFEVNDIYDPFLRRGRGSERDARIVQG